MIHGEDMLFSTEYPKDGKIGEKETYIKGYYGGRKKPEWDDTTGEYIERYEPTYTLSIREVIYDRARPSNQIRDRRFKFVVPAADLEAFLKVLKLRSNTEELL